LKYAIREGEKGKIEMTKSVDVATGGLDQGKLSLTVSSAVA
jgi:hypothetical protein